ncbi:MAG: hypothetical protein JNM78_09415 [Cyclobacteriaceae bacterium]|nr:hypothetical protein [Cyclobacteriaceae bacterium]
MRKVSGDDPSVGLQMIASFYYPVGNMVGVWVVEINIFLKLLSQEATLIVAFAPVPPYDYLFIFDLQFD